MASSSFSSTGLEPTDHTPWRSIAMVGAPLATVAVVPLLTGNLYHVHIAIMICLNIVFAAGLAIIARVGQLSLCHGAFVGVGAYASVLATMHLEWIYPLSFLASGLVSAALAALLGWIILRLRGVYFVLVTFAFGELFRLILMALPALSGGANGIANIPPVTIAGLTLEAKPAFYPLALIAAVLVVIFNWRLFRSPLGKRFDAIEEQQQLAEATGVNTHRTQVVAFVLGSAVAGFGGSLMAHYVGYISPESFTFWLSVNFIVMLVVGGRLSVWGPVAGAVVLTPLPELLRNTLELQHILYGVFLIAALRFLPQGLVSLPGRIRALTGSGGQGR